MSSPVTEVQMLIRKPASEVLNAFIDPEITKNFWFTKSSGRLDLNKVITWEWEMYGVSTIAVAREIIPDSKLVFEWNDPVRQVEINLNKTSADTTYVVITESGYIETEDDLLQAIKDSTGGFTTVLDGLKAWLEHGINLNLIADKFAGQTE